LVAVLCLASLPRDRVGPDRCRRCPADGQGVGRERAASVPMLGCRTVLSV